MLQKTLYRLGILFAFALTQLAVSLHVVEHASQLAQHAQSDKHVTTEVCNQCVAFAHLASTLPLQGFHFYQSSHALLIAEVEQPYQVSAPTSYYRARAPPYAQ